MTRCPESARVAAAIRQSLSEEISSSLGSLSGELKAHLAACPACAAEAAALDPTLLFAPLAASVSSDVPVRGARRPVAADARLVAESVLDEIRRRARVSPAAAPVRRGFSIRRFAEVAALLVLTAGLAGVFRWERLHPAREAVRTPEVPAPPAAEAAAPTRPLIEGVLSRNARVYEFAASSSGEPSVVFVANPNADL